MSYTSLVELKKYMPSETILQLTDDANVGSIEEEIVDEAISQAQVMIDGYLKGRYPDDIADADVPALIQDIATKIAAYNLYRRKLATTLPEALSTDYKYAISVLKDIQSGKITPFPVADEPVVIKSNKTSDSKYYNTDKWGTYWND
jgi:phage gp36-like protein